MKEQLKALLALAEIDNEINSLREIKEARPKQLEPFRVQAQGGAEKVQRVTEELRRLKMASDQAEREIREKEEKITKCQVQLNSAKTNEEYQVLQEQKGKLREEVSQKEEEGLEILSKTEQLAEELKRAEEEHRETRKELDAAEEETAGEIAQIDERLAALNRTRTEAAQGVEQKYLAQYDRILERHHDRAVVAVEGGVCQGCYMSVTPQMINTLMLGREIVLCKSCQRILYVPE
jgi:predicted  nucleic acid-binding Zn-ribbon protein